MPGWRIHRAFCDVCDLPIAWIPAFAGMTALGMSSRPAKIPQGFNGKTLRYNFPQCPDGEYIVRFAMYAICPSRGFPLSRE
ncbi:MAG: hypothetical protein ACRD18_06350 [Terriglobia bacterium]